MKNAIDLVVPENNLPPQIKHLGIIACRVFYPKRRSVNHWDSRVVMRSASGRKVSRLIQISHQAMTETGTERVMEAVSTTALKLIQNVNAGVAPTKESTEGAEPV